MDFRAELCGNSTCLCALVEVGPRLTFTVEGGVTGNLLVSDPVLCELYGTNMQYGLSMAVCQGSCVPLV